MQVLLGSFLAESIFFIDPMPNPSIVNGTLHALSSVNLAWTRSLYLASGRQLYCHNSSLNLK